MTTKETLHIALSPPPIQYDIVIGDHLIDQAFSFAKSHALRPIVVTTTDLQELLPPFKEEKIILPREESIKSRAMKEKIEDALIERGYGRNVCLIAFGGGALLDLVGFVAATYCRGISYISIPSTLIAMTDAALGGKTGVNVEEAKNWIGAFHHPRQVLIDLNYLSTLSQKEFVIGLSETIKHSLIADESFFFFLEEHLDALLNRDLSILHEMVWRSCRIKKEIVEKDPYEMVGLRRILNFGHTVGHALETLSSYTRPHGKAVLMGMLVEASIAHHLDYLTTAAFERICRFFDRLPVVMDFPDHLPYEMMARDKKGAHTFVVPTDIGRVAPFDGEYVTTLSKEAFLKGWEHVMCPH